MSFLQKINPEELGIPRGYSNGMLAPAGARTLVVAGQIAWDGDQNLVSENFAEQFRQALSNVLTVVRSAGGEAEHIAELTIFAVDVDAYRGSLKEIGAAWRELMGRHFPAMALIGIQELVEPGALVEIQGLAFLPQASS